MVSRHLPTPHRFICLTDKPEQIDGVTMIQVDGEGWWAKMALFSPEIRGGGPCLYFDLDTVVVGDLTPIASVDVEFGICGNFSRVVSPRFPCKYGSCIMRFSDGFGQDVHSAFMADRERLMRQSKLGDQYVIEQLYPKAVLFQDVLPKG